MLLGSVPDSRPPRSRPPRPDFLIVGAPKAGTTALHAGLARHPDVFTTTPKEPKYFLCDEAPPPAWHGPGDAHSQQEWVWRRKDYERLFEDAGPAHVRGESTPFYLWSRGAHRRIAEALPDVRLVAVVRDPIDRAYSNWMHLWSDGLEPVGDFEQTFSLQQERIDAGWAPFWRYVELGRYGEQLAHLHTYVDPERVLVIRYREIVDRPAETVDRVCRFLGIREGLVDWIPRDNSRNFVVPGWRPRTLGPLIRAGAWAGQFAPPQVWRAASRPMVSRLSGREMTRPEISPQAHARLIRHFADDIHRLSELTGEDFSDWLRHRPGGAFGSRQRPRRSVSAPS